MVLVRTLKEKLHGGSVCTQAMPEQAGDIWFACLSLSCLSTCFLAPAGSGFQVKEVYKQELGGDQGK